MMVPKYDDDADSVDDDGDAVVDDDSVDCINIK
jgi:hypothetical protein